MPFVLVAIYLIVMFLLWMFLGWFIPTYGDVGYLLWMAGIFGIVFILERSRKRAARKNSAELGTADVWIAESPKEAGSPERRNPMLGRE